MTPASYLYLAATALQAVSFWWGAEVGAVGFGIAAYGIAMAAWGFAR